jgi:hypothetical protein
MLVLVHQVQALVGAELDEDLLLESTGGLLEVSTPQQPATFLFIVFVTPAQVKVIACPAFALCTSRTDALGN